MAVDWERVCVFRGGLKKMDCKRDWRSSISLIWSHFKSHDEKLE